MITIYYTVKDKFKSLDVKAEELIKTTKRMEANKNVNIMGTVHPIARYDKKGER